MRLLLVCLGGALGSGLRYLFGLLSARLLGLTFPFGTLGVNLLGSFLISLIIGLSLSVGVGGSAPISPTLRLFLTTGVMGGLTTYSAFNHEVLTLLEDGAQPRALLYVAVTLLGCLAMGASGLWLSRQLLAR
ncbi:MAG TPA: fluoride efflux transporter CrcB [Pseudomonadota bacterium]|nr:fluoride efflux transporter CrcB [Pseudomonadota bacterium]